MFFPTSLNFFSYEIIFEIKKDMTVLKLVFNIMIKWPNVTPVQYFPVVSTTQILYVLSLVANTY